MTLARTLALGAAIVLLSRAPALAQHEQYPARPVKFLVPFAPGGGTDAIARLLGSKLEARLGKPFVIENRAGAGTVIAAAATATAPADGYTILMGTSSTQAINATLYKKLPYDPANDLVPVALICSVPFVLVVNPSLPINDVADLVSQAKSAQLNYGSGGPGSFHHLMAETLKTVKGIPMAHVPYKGSAPALNDLVAGHIQVMFSDLAPAHELIKAGKLRALGVTTAQRAVSAPEIPSLAELGLREFDMAAWQMVLAPAGTPKEILAALNTELNAIVADPEVSDLLVGLGLIPIGKGALEENAAFVKSETARWGRIVQQAGVGGSQ